MIQSFLVRLDCILILTLWRPSHKEQDAPFALAFTHEFKRLGKLVLHSQEVHQTSLVLVLSFVELVSEKDIRLKVQIVVGCINGNEQVKQLIRSIVKEQEDYLNKDDECLTYR